MYLLINPNHQYVIQTTHIIPKEWTDNFTLQSILCINLPIINFKKIDICPKYIPQIYNEEIDKEVPLLHLEYCIILCDICVEWLERDLIRGSCDKCDNYICNNCSNKHNNGFYCKKCYDNIVDNHNIN